MNSYNSMNNQQQQPQNDALFQQYDRNLYKIAGDETETDQIFDALAGTGNSNASMNQGSAVASDPSMSGSGYGNSTVQNTSGSAQAGKTKFDNTETGYILGVDNGIPKFYIGSPTKYINWDGVTLTIKGATII